MLTPSLNHSGAYFESLGSIWSGIRTFVLDNGIGQSILTLIMQGVGGLLIYLAAPW
jgi:hypothetical protein